MSLHLVSLGSMHFLKKLKMPSVVVWSLFGNFVFYVAAWAILSCLAVVLKSRFGYSGLQVGLVVGFGALVGIIAGLFVGYLSDIFGRRQLLVASIVFFAILALIMYLTNSAILFSLAAAGFYIAKSIYDVLLRALISDLTTSSNKEIAFAIRFLTLNLWASVGPWFVVSSGIALDPILYKYCSIVFFFYAVVLVALIPKYHVSSSEELGIKKSIAVLKKDRPFLLLTIAAIFFVLCLTIYGIVMSQYLFDIKGQAGLNLFASMCLANCLAICLLQFPSVIVASRFDAYHVVATGMFVLVIGFLLLLYTEPSWTYVLALAIIGFGETLVSAKLDVIVDKMAGSGLKGLYFGAFTAMQLGVVIGPISGGILLDYFGKMFLLLPVVAGALGMVLVVLARYKQYQNKSEVKGLESSL